MSLLKYSEKMKILLNLSAVYQWSTLRMNSYSLPFLHHIFQDVLIADQAIAAENYTDFFTPRQPELNTPEFKESLYNRCFDFRDPGSLVLPTSISFSELKQHYLDAQTSFDFLKDNDGVLIEDPCKKSALLFWNLSAREYKGTFLARQSEFFLVGRKKSDA